jgi:hypothetical protein
VLTLVTRSALSKVFVVVPVRGQWTALEVYLSDGRVEIDNNLVENAIRSTAVGKKNWPVPSSPSPANDGSGAGLSDPKGANGRRLWHTRGWPGPQRGTSAGPALPRRGLERPNFLHTFWRDTGGFGYFAAKAMDGCSRLNVAAAKKA